MALRSAMSRTASLAILASTLSSVATVAAASGPAKGRVVSVADLHGDYGRTEYILKHAGLVVATSDGLKWSGGSATLVQTGDMLDRGDDGKRIFELFARLREEAPKAGGTVVNLLGNHELMNLQGDFRYVSPGDFEAFGGEEKRAEAWKQGGWIHDMVVQFPAAEKVGAILFVHAGLLPNFLGAEREEPKGLNKDFADALLAGNWNSPLFHDEGPVWTRFYAGEGDQAAESAICTTAMEVLRKVGATRMVMGHTVQDSFHVRPLCEGHVVLADTAISRAYGGEPSYTEYDALGDSVVVYPRLEKRVTLPTPPEVARSTTVSGSRRTRACFPQKSSVLVDPPGGAAHQSGGNGVA